MVAPMPLIVWIERNSPPTGSAAPGSRSHASSSWLQLLRCSRLSARKSAAYFETSTGQPRTRCTASSTREG